MKYSLITQKKKTYPVGLMCRLLGVSRSAYYEYEQRRSNRPDDLYHKQLLDAVQNIAKSCDYTYGSRRMKRALNALGYRVSRWKDPLIRTTMGCQLNRQFAVTRQDQVYDITYIWTQESCVSGGCHCQKGRCRMKATLVCDALRMAICASATAGYCAFGS